MSVESSPVESRRASSRLEGKIVPGPRRDSPIARQPLDPDWTQPSCLGTNTPTGPGRPWAPTRRRRRHIWDPTPGPPACPSYDSGANRPTHNPILRPRTSNVSLSPKLPQASRANPPAPGLPQGTIHIRPSSPSPDLAADGLSNQRRLLVDVIGRRTSNARCGCPRSLTPTPTPSPTPSTVVAPTQITLPPTARPRQSTDPTRMQQLILSPPLAEPGQQRTEGGRHDGRPRR